MSDEQIADTVRVKKVLVCGSRNLGKEGGAQIYRVLHDLAQDYDGQLLIIHGAAPGADAYADHWAETNGVAQWRFPADWAKHGRAAGPIRNQVMLDVGMPDVVYAFPDKNSVGTWDMVKRAKDAGVEVYVMTGVGLALIDGDVSG